MGTLRIVPFDESHLNEAAGLLAARHRRDREREPALPAHFVEASAARTAVLAAWREADASGVAARRDGRMAGFLLGAPEIAEVWGRSVWVHYGGHALAPAEDADLYRDLYAAAAPKWLANWCFAHYIEMPADDRAGLDAWFALSFGQQQGFGICHLPAGALPNIPREPDFTIRRATPEDRQAVAEMARILWEHMGRSPVYSVRLPVVDGEQFLAAADEALADPQVVVWLAERDGVALGAVEITPLTPGDDLLDVPENCCFLRFAATRPAARGQGISTALTAHALREAHAAGYVTALTDWRVTNLPAARLWPRLGFRPFQYRLHRLIDERIALAASFPD